MTAPLNGTRVLEIAQNLAGPWSGRLLAQLGADVVKVEPPEGDAMRHTGVGGRSFVLFNGGKRGIALDLADAADRGTIEDLVRWADVVLIALKPSDVDKFDLGHERLAALNPSIVYAMLSGLGVDGPQGREGGYDILVQAASGLGFATARELEGTPETVRPAYSDFGTGFTTTIGILAAIVHRMRTGQGQRVDTSLLATALNYATPFVSWFERDDDKWQALAEHRRAGGWSLAEEQSRFDTITGAAGPLMRMYFRSYATADGFVAVGALSPALRRRLLDAIGLGGMADAPTEELIPLAVARFAQRTTDEWLSVLRAAGVPCARFNHVHDVKDDPQVQANGYLAEVHDPKLGRHLVPQAPLTMSASPLDPLGPAPRLDEHREEVLAAIRTCTIN